MSFNTDRLVEGDKYDYVTRTSFNQGVLRTSGFVNQENINQSGTWSLGLLQLDFFYRKKPWYAGQFVRKIIPKFNTTDEIGLFFTTILNGLKQKLSSVLVRNIDSTFLNSNISLPISQDGEIDFEYIISFISGIKSNHTKHLREYIIENELNDCNLTCIEQESLRSIKNGDIQWGEHKIEDIFEKVPTVKLSYQAKELPEEPIEEYILPCLTSSFRNQGLNYYAPKDRATILKNVISIPSNSDVYRAYFQSNEFTVLSDAYAIRWKDKSRKISQNQYLFMVMCINKVTDLPIYSYKNKLGGWNVVKNKYIQLPVIDGSIDYDFMENLISAIKKLTIKDVVSYVAKKEI